MPAQVVLLEDTPKDVEGTPEKVEDVPSADVDGDADEEDESEGEQVSSNTIDFRRLEERLLTLCLLQVFIQIEESAAMKGLSQLDEWYV